MSQVVIPFPDELIEAIAERVARLLEVRLVRQRESPWLGLDATCDYLGLSHDTVYKLSAARAIPARKKEGGQGLIFHRDELDEWVISTYSRLDRVG